MTSAEQVRDWAAAAGASARLPVRVCPDGLAPSGTDGAAPVPWDVIALDLPSADRQTGPGAVRRWALALAWASREHPAVIADLVRVVGMARSHPFHPGPRWARVEVHGASLDLGLGAAGLDPERPDAVLPVPQAVWDALAVDAGEWWPRARILHERMGEMSALRWAGGATSGRLRPTGGHDVVTLLGTATLRQALSDRGEHGMCGVAVPLRDEGWVTTRMVDPAFAAAASGIADEHERGFVRPVLVTRDEVVEPPDGGTHAIALGDQSPHGADDPPEPPQAPYFVA